MSRIIEFPLPPRLAAESPPADAAAAAFEQKCFDAYRSNTGSRGLVDEYTDRCLASVRDLLKWSQKPLAQLTEGDYEAWSTYLARERGILPSTQRTYQKGVRQVFNFLTSRQELQNEAYRLFGSRIELVAHRENSIIHSVEDEAATRRPPLNHDDMTTLLDTIDQLIDVSEVERPRAARGLKRDYAAIYTSYIYGLRISELVALSPESFCACPDLPELGNFGMLRVTHGKGAKGSGKRHRLIPTTHAGYVHFIQWYIDEVRPLYKPDATRREPLFLNERGGSLSDSSLQKSFKALIIAAGLDPDRYSPHSLRRAMVQHEMMRAPAELARAKAGHQSMGTTQIYGQVPPEHHRSITRRLIRKSIEHAKKTSK